MMDTKPRVLGARVNLTLDANSSGLSRRGAPPEVKGLPFLLIGWRVVVTLLGMLFFCVGGCWVHTAIAPALFSLEGHTELLVNAAFSPDGTRLATASLDKTAKVWDVRTGTLLFTLSGHTGYVTNVAFSPDGTLLVTASTDKTAKVWMASTGKLLFTMKGHSDELRGAWFSPDNTMVATVSLDHTAKLWAIREANRQTGKLHSGRLIATLEGHADGVVSARFSPDSTRVVTGSRDGTAKVWVAQDALLVRGKLLSTLFGHKDRVWHAEFSSDGACIITTSGDNTSKVWAIQREEASSAVLLFTLSAQHSSAESNPNNTRVVSASTHKTAKVWSTEDASDVKLLFSLEGHKRKVVDAMFSRDGTRIVTASWDKTAKVWDANTGKLLLTLQGHKDKLRSASFSPDGTLIVTISEDKTVKLWKTP